MFGRLRNSWLSDAAHRAVPATMAQRPTRESVTRRVFGRRRTIAARNGVFIVIASLCFLYGAASLIDVPEPRPQNAPVGEFSAARAIRHVAAIGRRPHPAGSEAMADVARYLVAQLEDDGVRASIQSVQDSDGWDSKPFVLHNVVARIPGADSTGSILFVAHPDSTPFGPGAGDNATGAAVLAETARALAASAPLNNDVIFLFDDGEELGYRGGYAFAASHPWMKDVRLAVGLDTAAWGPVTALEVPNNNATTISGYAAAVDAPTSFGFHTEANIKFGGDDSELEPFVERGIPGIDLEDPSAFVGKHDVSDTVGHIQAQRLQQMGDQVLALARSYGSMDLGHESSSDQVFFSLWGFGLVHYPIVWGTGLAALAIGLFATAVWLGKRRGLLRWRPVLAATGCAVSMVIAGKLVGAAATAVFAVLFPNPNPNVDNYIVSWSLPFTLLSGLVMGTGFVIAHRWLSRRLGPCTLAMGFLGAWLIVAILFAVVIPAGSYLFELPLVAALVAWTWILARHPVSVSSGMLALFVSIAVALVLASSEILLSYISIGARSVSDLPPLVVLLAGLGASVWALEPRFKDGEQRTSVRLTDSRSVRATNEKEESGSWHSDGTNPLLRL
jgi:Peptidase family M28